MAAIHVSNSTYKTGFLNRVFHNDVDSTFEGLRKVAEIANESCEQLFGYHNQTRRIIDAMDERIKAHDGRLYSIDGSLYSSRNAMAQTVTVVDKHSAEIAKLAVDSNQLQGRMATLEELRNSDREAEAKNVAMMNEIHKQVIELETLPTKLAEEHQATAEAFSSIKLRFSEGDLERKEQSSKIQTLFQSNEELIAEIVLLKKAQQAALERQGRENGELKTLVADLAHTIQGLVTHVAILSSWKEQATRQHERHENILFLFFKLQSDFTQYVASVNQSTQGIGAKLDLLLEKNGIPTTKTEMPPADSTNIQADMKAISQAFEDK